MEYIIGDIWKTQCNTIAVPVNTVGAAGAGMAKEFRKLFPQEHERYRELCLGDKLRIGEPRLVFVANKRILLFPTKDDWRQPSRIEWIESGLKHFVEDRDGWQFLDLSIAFPCLGCGLGGLKWVDVKPIMGKYLSDLPFPVYIYLKE